MSAARDVPDLESCLAQHRVIVCAGTGGVGKTTTSAAIALAAAQRGECVAVLTIDPARRLADALGVDPSGDAAADGADGGAAIAVAGGGSLQVFTLDSRRTFDRLVHRYAPDEATRERILRNTLYEQIVTTVAGSAEYAALERVYEIAEQERFDRVIVDTPPAGHALDFLEAPGRISEFLESRLVHLLVQPTLAAGRFGLRIFEGAAHSVLSLIERVSGLDFLEDLSELLVAIESLAEGLHSRAVGLAQLLRSSDTCFLLVTAAEATSTANAERFLDQLGEADVRVAGILANRVRVWPGHETLEQLEAWRDDAPALARAEENLARALATPLGTDELAASGARAANELATGYASQVLRDHEALASLRQRAQESGGFLQVIPEFAEDVHDLGGLHAIIGALFAEQAAGGTGSTGSTGG